MNTKSAVLAIFEAHRGEAISGAELAAKLSVSRNAVWKAVKELQKEGYSIEGIPNRGYCFSITNDLLSPEGMLPYLDKPQQADNILIYKTVDSTNSLAKKLALDGAGHGTVILAEAQTAGRGRKGRSFYSPAQKGIYMSLILRPRLRMDQALWMTAAAAVLAAQALEAVQTSQVQIKWVNDLYIAGKKVCGILTEAATNWESGEVQHIILGLGINITAPDGGFPDELQHKAGTVAAEEKQPVLRNALAAHIINKMLEFCAELEADTEALQRKIMAEYRQRSCVIGQWVKILDYPGLEAGLVKDIDEQGFLVVEDAQGQSHILSSGEVTLRLTTSLHTID